MKHATVLLFISAVIIGTSSGPINAQNYTISGTVTDERTGEPLEAANVAVTGTAFGDATDSQGRYLIRNITPGEWTIDVSYIGYFTKRLAVRVPGDLEHDVALKQRSLESPEVVVTATRARDRETPVAFSDVSRDEIETKYDLQDIPLMLNDAPGVYSYSETGANIGYTYMKIRGFDQSRIGVMLNGIPLNDPESHQVYWVDLADFGENIENIQIQRGVGNSLYGSAAIGGSVNVVTHNFSSERKISFKTGYGSYNTKKLSFGMTSGLIDNRYAIYGRYSKLNSGGYRDNAWADLWSYFFSAVRFDDRMTNKINIYGGPELTHLTYEGITQDRLKTDRTFNPLSDPDDVDDTFQPHYELLTEIAISDRLYFNNALYFTSAKGFYRNIKNRRDLFEYDLSPFTTTDPAPYRDVADFRDPDENGEYELKKTDLVRRRWIDNYQWGLIPRLEILHDRGRLTVGAEARIHRGRHWGEVIWLPVPIPGVEPGHRYYDYVVRKNSLSAFVHEQFSLTPDLTVMADLQYMHHSYDFGEDKRNNIAFDVSYNFLTPRLGMNYNVSDAVNVFGNFSIARREPVFRALYDAQYAYSTPVFGGANYTNPLVRDEKMYDYETGAGYSGTSFSGKINLYYMDFRNELIRYGGQLDEEGVAVAGNAKKSYHSGIEISSSYRVVPELTLRLNASFSRDRLVKHSEFINNWNKWPPGEEVNLDGNRIGGFPDRIINGIALFKKRGFTGRLHLQHIGKQFVDNTENERKNPDARNTPGYVDKYIDAYTLLNARFTWKMGKVVENHDIELGISLYNILDADYVATGYIDEIPLFIPGPGRNFFLSLNYDI